VTGYLLPALGLPADRVLTKDQFRPGAPVVEEFERAVGHSRFTAVVLTPAYLADEWSVFGEQLASHAAVADGRNRLIPVLLEPCELPLHVEFRVRLDYTDAARWDAQSARLRELLDRPEPPPEDLACPYPGLVPFDAGQARFFHGRDNEVAELLRRLRHQRFILVVGPSGSGKSSLVLAGLLPELARRQPGRWLVRSLRPGAAPLRSLTDALGGSGDQGQAAPPPPTRVDLERAVAEMLQREEAAERLLLVVDQLEEVFAQASAADRSGFLTALLTLYEVDRCTVVATMRADFYPELMVSELWPVDPVERVEVTPLRGAALRRAIEQPALDVGVQLEPGLTERLLADAADEPGALPLVQETMVLLWEERRQRLLTVAAYDMLGVDGRSGLAVALATRADAALAALSPAQRLIARRIFLREVQLGEGRDDTRRQQPVASLRAATEDPKLFDETLAHLAGQRLLTLSGEEEGEARTVDLAHEALIQAWPAMRRWIEQDRQGLRVQRQLSDDAEEWQALRRDPSALYRGVRLAAAQEWASEHPDELNALERAFLDASHIQEASELEAAQRTNRRLRLLLRSLGALLVVVVAASALALLQSVRASREARRATLQLRLATSRQLAAQAVATPGRHVARSLLLSLAALRADDTPEARSALLATLQASDPRAVAFLQGPGGPVRSVAFGRDGRILASGSQAGRVLLWDAVRRVRLGPPIAAHRNVVQALAFSPDRRTLASGGFDGKVVLWDVAGARPLGDFPVQDADRTRIWSVAFSPDGRMLAAGATITVAPGRVRHAVLLWEVEARRSLGELPVRADGDIASVAFGPGGNRLSAASLHGAVTVWDLLRRRTSRPLLGGDDFANQGALSRDGHLLALSSKRRTVELWDLRAARRPPRSLTGHVGDVEDVAISADGRLVAAGSNDRTVIVWDARTGRRLGKPLSGHDAKLESVAFAPDRHVLASGSDDGMVILWDLGARSAVGTTLAGHSDGAVWGVAFSPNGRTFASGSDDGTVSLWDTATGRRKGEPLAARGKAQSVAFSPDGRTLAAGGDAIVLWDPTTRRRLAELPLNRDAAATAVAFSPDGGTLAAGDEKGSILLWDVATRQRLTKPLPGHAGLVTRVAFSLDSRALASGGQDGAILLWDVAGRRPLGELPVQQPEPVRSIAFHPKDGTLASGHQDGTIVLWDVARRRALGAPLAGNGGPVYGLAFSPDGGTLASGGPDSVVLWRVDDQGRWRRLVESLRGHAATVASVAFSPDGRRLASGSWDRTIGLWDVDLASWQAHACALTNRNLGRAEWEQLLERTLPYEPTCPDLPPG
jgi:WD40 repeat protein/energy-coupling factor transporter ATP-binding protein EcfA2